MIPSGAKVRLLALDDDLALAELIARTATQCGYEARALDSSYFLPRLLRDWAPHVLTLDLTMPEEDGMSVLSMLQKRRFAGAIVIISGHEGWLRKTACRLAAGHGLNVVEDLEKPVDLATLRRALEKATLVHAGAGVEP